MTVTIPVWLLWVAGGVVALVILALAVFGAFMLRALPARFF